MSDDDDVSYASPKGHEASADTFALVQFMMDDAGDEVSTMILECHAIKRVH